MRTQLPDEIDLQKAFVTGRHCLPPPPLEREFAPLGWLLDPRDSEPVPCSVPSS